MEVTPVAARRRGQSCGRASVLAAASEADSDAGSAGQSPGDLSTRSKKTPKLMTEDERVRDLETRTCVESALVGKYNGNEDYACRRFLESEVQPSAKSLQRVRRCRSNYANANAVNINILVDLPDDIFVPAITDLKAKGFTNWPAEYSVVACQRGLRTASPLDVITEIYNPFYADDDDIEDVEESTFFDPLNPCVGAIAAPEALALASRQTSLFSEHVILPLIQKGPDGVADIDELYTQVRASWGSPTALVDPNHPAETKLGATECVAALVGLRMLKDTNIVLYMQRS